jgi:hypothetical protein
VTPLVETIAADLSRGPTIVDQPCREGQYQSHPLMRS